MTETLLSCALAASVALNLWQYLSRRGDSTEEFGVGDMGTDEILTTPEKWVASCRPRQ